MADPPPPPGEGVLDADPVAVDDALPTLLDELDALALGLLVAVVLPLLLLVADAAAGVELELALALALLLDVAVDVADALALPLAVAVNVACNLLSYLKFCSFAPKPVSKFALAARNSASSAETRAAAIAAGSYY